MNNNLTDAQIEQIERYLLNQMNTDEANRFEQELSSDDALKNNTEFLRNVIKASEKSADAITRELLKNIESRVAPDIERNLQKPLRQRFFYRFAGVAALIIAVVAVASLFLNQESAHEKLYLAYFEPPENTFVNYTRGEIESPISGLTSDTYTLLIRASKHYDKKNYNKAAQLFNTYLIENAELINFFHLSAMSNLESGNDNKALENLLFLAENYNSKYATYYYLSLLYIKMGNSHDAIEMLNKSLENNEVKPVEIESIKKELHALND